MGGWADRLGMKKYSKSLFVGSCSFCILDVKCARKQESEDRIEMRVRLQCEIEVENGGVEVIGA